MIYFLLNSFSENNFVILETSSIPDAETLLKTMQVFKEIIANSALCTSIPSNFPINPNLPETHLSVLISLHSHLHSVVSKMTSLQQKTLSHLQQELQEIKTSMISLSWESFNILSQTIPSYIQFPDLELPTTSSSYSPLAEEAPSTSLPFSPLVSSSSSFGSLTSLFDETTSSDIDSIEQAFTQPFLEKAIASPSLPFSPLVSSSSSFGSLTSLFDETISSDIDNIEQTFIQPFLEKAIASPTDHSSFKRKTPSPNPQPKDKDLSKIAGITSTSSSFSFTETLIKENLPPLSPIALLDLSTDDIVASDGENISTSIHSDQHLPTQKEKAFTTTSPPLSDDVTQALIPSTSKKPSTSSIRKSSRKRKVLSKSSDCYTKRKKITVPSSSFTKTLIEENLSPLSPIPQKSPIALLDLGTDDIVASDDETHSIPTTAAIPIPEQEKSPTILKAISPKRTAPAPKKRTKKQKLSTELESTVTPPTHQSSTCLSKLSYFVFPCFVIRKFCKKNSRQLNLQVRYKGYHCKELRALRRLIKSKISFILSIVQDLTVINPNCDIACMFYKSTTSSFTCVNLRTDLLYIILMGLKHTLEYYQERATTSQKVFVIPSFKKEVLSTIACLEKKLAGITPSPLCAVPGNIMQQIEKTTIQEIKDCPPIRPVSSTTYSLPLFFISLKAQKMRQHYGLSYTCRHDLSEKKLFVACIDSLRRTVAHANSLIKTPFSKITSYDPFSSQKKIMTSFDEAIPLILNGLQENFLFFENHPGNILDRPKHSPLRMPLKKVISELRKTVSPSIKRSALPTTPQILNQILNKEKSKKPTREKISTKSKIQETPYTSSSKTMKKNTLGKHLPMFWIRKQSKGTHYQPYILSYLMRGAHTQAFLIKKINMMLEKNINLTKEMMKKEWIHTAVTWIHPNTKDSIRCSSLNEAISLIFQGFEQILFYYTKDPHISPMNILSFDNLEQLNKLMSSISSSKSILPSCLLSPEFIQHMVEAYQKTSNQKDPT